MSLCFLVSVLQEEEGGVCPEVVHAEARRQCSRLTGAQRKSPADRARHAPPPLLARITTRRNPDRVEGRQRDPAVRSLNAGDRPPGAGRRPSALAPNVTKTFWVVFVRFLSRVDHMLTLRADEQLVHGLVF